MKTLLAISLLILQVPSSMAGELDSISLITPMSYDLSSSSTQTFKSKVKVGIGDLINTDVAAAVNGKVAPYKKDLAPYFKQPGELDTFVNKIVNDGKNSIIGNDLSDAKLIKFYEYLGNKLIGGFADRILATEGVKDQSRRDLWVAKMMAPFNACINKSKNSQYDASHCMDALTSSLVPSTGIGLVYEMSRSSLGNSLPEKDRPAFYADQVKKYKDCMKGSGEASKVKGCALEAMRAGVLKVTDLKLTKTINDSASSPAMAKTIKTAVMPGLNVCTDQVGRDANSKVALSDQFMNCIDDLVKSTGSLIVQDKVENTPAVRGNFSKLEIGKLSKDKSSFFKECIDEQKKNNVRKDGMLDTSRCENSITNDITYKVVVKTLAQTANDSFKGDLKLSADLSKEGKALLDKCWDNDQSGKEREACLRKTILAFSQRIGAEKLDNAIPDDMKNKKDLVASALKDLNSCLEKQLPSNISEAQDLNARTSACSNKLTLSVAQKVAQDTIRAKAHDNKIDQDSTDSLVQKYVDRDFMNCLGSTPTDAKLDSCTGQLKKNAAVTMGTAQIRLNAAGKVSPAETETLIDNLVNKKFKSCLGNNPSDTVLNSCIGDLTKGATKSIVLAYEKKQIKDQLNADSTPEKLKPVEDAFVACTEKNYPTDQVSKSLDECTKQFALDFARTLGELKLTSLMKSVLGSDNYAGQKKNIDDMLGKYNQCLDGLKQYSMEDGLLDKLTTCTDDLQRRGVNFVTNTVNTWMSTEEKDAATIMVKNEFANFIPCLSALLPASPYDPNMDKNVTSVLKPVALLLAQYIEYSPEDAKRTLEDITKKLSSDLKDVASNPASRQELIDMLYKNGALDQFLKSMVRAQVKTAIDATPESDLPKDIRAALLKKENFDAMFATAEGKAIKDMVMEKMLKPILMEQASMSSPLITAGMDAVKDRVVKMLVYAPSFGEQIVKSSIQNKINDMGGFTRFFAKAIYGKNSLNWDKVRATDSGKAAEKYIQDNYLLPKFNGKTMTKEEEKKIMGEAEKLVTTAVKNYE